jgi:hypothetical protein
MCFAGAPGSSPADVTVKAKSKQTAGRSAVLLGLRVGAGTDVCAARVHLETALHKDSAGHAKHKHVSLPH